MTIPIARQYYFGHIASTLDSMNVDVSRILVRNNVPQWQYSEPEDAIPLIHFIKMFEIGARIVGEKHFGTVVAGHNGMDNFARFGESIKSAFTIYEALKITSRLARQQVTTLQIWLTQRHDGVLFCRKQFVSHPDIKTALLLLEQYTLTELVRIVRLGAGADWCPPMAYLSTSTQPTADAWDSFKDTTFIFEMPFSAIFVPNHILSRPINRHSASPAENPKYENWTPNDFVSNLRHLLRSAQSQNCADIETASEASGISTRTMRRRLADRGTSFRKVLEQARYQMAIELLSEPEREIAEISDLVGYEHPQHFIRAFRRWSGSTPGTYRKGILTTDQSLSSHS